MRDGDICFFLMGVGEYNVRVLRGFLAKMRCLESKNWLGRSVLGYKWCENELKWRCLELMGAMSKCHARWRHLFFSDGVGAYKMRVLRGLMTFLAKLRCFEAKNRLLRRDFI
jgi:hypothetical protein